MSLRPKTIKLSLVPLVLSRSHLIHQQTLLAIHLKYASTTLPTLPLPPLTHCWHLVRPGTPRLMVPASQLLSRLPFPPHQTTLHTPVLSKEQSHHIVPLLATFSQLPNTKRIKAKVLITTYEGPDWPGCRPPFFGPPSSVLQPRCPSHFSPIFQAWSSPRFLHLLFPQPRCPHSWCAHLGQVSESSSTPPPPTLPLK